MALLNAQYEDFTDVQATVIHSKLSHGGFHFIHT